MSLTKDTILYDRLGVAFNATSDEIAKAGRKMSMKWHPDKHHTEKDKAHAEEKFKEIRDALDILSDSQKRSQYDQVGLEGMKGGASQSQSSPFGFPFGMGGGMGMPFGFNQGRQPQVPEPIVHHLSVTLDKIAKEELMLFTYSRKVKCGNCNGEGATDCSKIIDCRECKGSGTCIRIQQMGPMTQHVVIPCEKCGRKGKVIPDVHKCVKCSGNGNITVVENAQIKLQKTLDNEMKLKLEGKGHALKNGTSDLIVVIHIEPHEAFERNGCHLITEIELSLYEALFGFTKTVYHLDGRIVKIQYRGKTDHGTCRKMIGDGFTDIRTGKQGNLYIYFVFTLPDIDRVDQIVDDNDDNNDNVKDNDKNDTNVKDNEYSAILDIDENDRQFLSNTSNTASSPRFANVNPENENKQQECRQM